MKCKLLPLETLIKCFVKNCNFFVGVEDIKTAGAVPFIEVVCSDKNFLVFLPFLGGNINFIPKKLSSIGEFLNLTLYYNASTVTGN